MSDNNTQYLLSIRNLKTHFHVHKRIIRAVDGVTLNVRAGKTLGAQTTVMAEAMVDVSDAEIAAVSIYAGK